MKFEQLLLQMKMLKSYKDSLIEIEQEIDNIVYQYAGVRGIRYDKQQVSFNEQIANDVRERMSKALEEPQKQLDFTHIAINNLEPIVNNNLSKLPNDVKEMMMLYVYEKRTYEYIGRKFGYTPNGVWNKVRREVSKI